VPLGWLDAAQEPCGALLEGGDKVKFAADKVNGALTVTAIQPAN
jgi:hypothetical protein